MIRQSKLTHRSSDEIEREFREVKKDDPHGLLDVRTYRAYEEAIEQAKRNEAIQRKRDQQERVDRILYG